MTWRSEPSAGWSWSSRPHVRGPLVGWRAWRVTAEGGVLRLRSAVFDDRWEPRRATVASCAHGHAAPERACACGLYAVADARDAVRYLVGRDDPGVVHRVLGEAALWGVTVEGERGWRAQLAAPARLVVPLARTNAAPVDAERLAAGLAAAYAIPVEILPAAEPPALARALAA